MPKTKFVSAYVVNIGPERFHQDPRGFQYFCGKKVKLSVYNIVKHDYESRIAFIKNESQLGLICDKQEELEGMKFMIGLYLEEFKTGFKYLVIDSLTPVFNNKDMGSSVEDFDTL